MANILITILLLTAMLVIAVTILVDEYRSGLKAEREGRVLRPDDSMTVPALR